MKLSKMTFMVGMFFLVMQFSTVFLYNEMFTISKCQGLPIDQLVQLSVIIMSVIIYSLILFGILFMVLMLAKIRQSLKRRFLLLNPHRNL